MNFLSKLTRVPYQNLLAFMGFCFIGASMVHISGKWGDFIFETYNTPNFYLFVPGILSLLGSLYLMFFLNGAFREEYSQKIKESKSGLETTFKEAKIFIHFGQLQTEVTIGDPKTAVVLPSNDLFDDGCFDDSKIALGGYLAHHFIPSQIVKLKSQRTDELKNISSEPIEDGLTKNARSYGAGTCLFLEESGHRLIVAAVSTKRKKEGVKAEIYFLHRAMHEVLKTVAEKELDTIYIPVIGSGKGGVPRKVALMSLLSAVYENICRPSGHHFQNVHIVVFKRDEASKPELSPSQVRYLLQMVLKLWE